MKKSKPETVARTVTFPPDLYALVEEAAREETRTKNAVIIRAIRAGLSK